MKQRRLLRFHGLKRPRVRQTWNKYNLFNLSRLRTPNLMHKTFFQQKWIAKSLTRGYHGEHIKEYQWERMFSRRSQSVVPMNPSYMARHDGSEQATGRGSGRKTDPKSNTREPSNGVNVNRVTPYVQMVFAPQERRLDIAIFRALFASSARQARQFVVHGAVTVNGKKMTHPSYLLNPGDMFQVDIERVMTATGKPKTKGTGNQKALPTTATEAADAEEADADVDAAATEPAASEAEPVDVEAAKEKHMAILKELKARAQKVLNHPNRNARAKTKWALRKYLKEVKAAMESTKKTGDSSVSKMSDVEAELSALFEEISLTKQQREEEAKKKVSNKKNTKEADDSSSSATTTTLGVLTPKQRRVLAQMMDNERANPYDSSKPYATPWQPRDWMAPFAFIPRYLEVNQRICAAVYLRHPVARPGMSEVPTPFSPTLSQLSFNWYLRRG